MLIEFSVANFRSIRGMQTLSMVAAPIVSKNKEIDIENVFETETEIKLLKSAIVYGANGSGKSNIVKALLSMMFFIRDSFSNEEFGLKISDPFKLDKTSKNKPTYYQLVFILDGKNYRYGFELKKGKVLSEWLFGPAKKKEVYYFLRENSKITINKNYFPEGMGLEHNKTKDTTLFLNVTHAFNGPVSNLIKNYFKEKIIINSGINDNNIRKGTMKMIDNEKHKQNVLNFLSIADFGISDFEKVVLDSSDLPDDAPSELKKQSKDGNKIEVLLSKRHVLDRKGYKVAEIEEPFDAFESEGTKKLFSYAGAILSTLAAGRLLVIDEFDSRFHPLLVKKIISFFNSNKNNKRRAQIILITHDTNLLDSSIFRRDQIFFTEKKKNGETELYSLMNIGGVRNDAVYEKDYMKGKYGGIPFIGNSKLEF